MGALCLVLAIVLTILFLGNGPNQDAVATASGDSSGISVGSISSFSKPEVSVHPVSSSPDASASSGSALDVTKEQHIKTGQTESSSPASEPKKPIVPDSSALTNSSQKPSYSKKQTHPSQSASQPKAGDKKRWEDLCGRFRMDQG